MLTTIFDFLSSYWETIFLLLSITFILSFIKHILHHETYDKFLGRSGLSGSVLGSILGSLTPICSCSVASIYAGLLSQGASLQAAGSFLFAAPAVNEFAVAIIFQIAGIKGALLYLIFGLISATFTGYFAKYFGLIPTKTSLVLDHHTHTRGLISAIKSSLFDTISVLKTLAIPVAFGVAVGQLLSLILPNFLHTAKQFGTAWYGPFLATAIGLPTHIEASAAPGLLLPIIKSGLPLGTAISLLMSTTISSLSEISILQKIIGKSGVIKLVCWYFFYCSLMGIFINHLFK